MFTHNQVGINCVIKYMYSNIKRISPGERFQKSGTASHYSSGLFLVKLGFCVVIVCNVCLSTVLYVPNVATLDFLLLITQSNFSNINSYWLKHHKLHVREHYCVQIIQIEDHSLLFNQVQNNINIEFKLHGAFLE